MMMIPIDQVLSQAGFIHLENHQQLTLISPDRQRGGTSVAVRSLSQQESCKLKLTPTTTNSSTLATSGPAPCSATTTPTLNNSKLPPKICPGTHCSNFCVCGGFLISALSGRRRKMVSYGLTMPTVVALTGPPCTQSIYILHGHWHRVFPSTM